MNRALTQATPQQAAPAGPHASKGVQDSAERTEFTTPTRRLGTSQDFGDREVSQTASAKAQRAAANLSVQSSAEAAGSNAPSHGTPRASPEQKRSWNPD